MKSASGRRRMRDAIRCSVRRPPPDAAPRREPAAARRDGRRRRASGACCEVDCERDEPRDVIVLVDMCGMAARARRARGPPRAGAGEVMFFRRRMGGGRMGDRDCSRTHAERSRGRERDGAFSGAGAPAGGCQTRGSRGGLAAGGRVARSRQVAGEAGVALTGSGGVGMFVWLYARVIT